MINLVNSNYKYIIVCLLLDWTNVNEKSARRYKKQKIKTTHFQYIYN